MANDEKNVERQTSYSPSSERETEERQHESPKGDAALHDPEIDKSAVRQGPGDGGVDDAGDIEAPPGELGDIDEVMRRGDRARHRAES
ncbi:hypothetical protein [Humibacter albus]|jgi:hypothetical protein|uniref:hypothetical protein n=1 Tax=Humibacter albus TaxID=427754 RepID=UPI0003B48417|nr:hypothetical protein [Humibacter albus]